MLFNGGGAICNHSVIAAQGRSYRAPHTRCTNEAVTKRAMGKPTPAHTSTAVVIVMICIKRALQNNTAFLENYLRFKASATKLGTLLKICNNTLCEFI